MADDVLTFDVVVDAPAFDVVVDAPVAVDVEVSESVVAVIEVSVSGPPGHDGADGQPGTDGVDGQEGPPGRDGVDGADGAQGIQGEQGVSGEQGVKGDGGISLDIEGSVGSYAALAALTPLAGQAWVNTADGLLYYYDQNDGFPASGQGVPFKGDQGVRGGIGPAGSSAYQQALDGGFSGTNAQWLASLHGTDGTDGVIASIVAGDYITVDDTDPANPVITAESGSQWDDVPGGIEYAGGKVGIGGVPTEYLDILGALATNIRMAYAAGPQSYANFIRNSFSGTPGNHQMLFVLKQNGKEHVMMTLSADGKVIFGGSPVFGGDMGINIGSATPKASLYVGSNSAKGYGNIEVLAFGLGADSNYYAGFRMTISGASANGNTWTFHVNTGIGGATAHDVYTVRGDGAMIFPAAAGPVLTDSAGGLWRLEVDTSGNLTTTSVTA